MSNAAREAQVKKWLLLATLIAGPVTWAWALEHENMLCANDNTPTCGRSRGEYLIFKNECELRKAQRENLMAAPLFDVALHYCLPGCEFGCEDVYQPICGVSVASNERRTFRNRCEMTRAGCYAKSDWLLYKWGVCPSSSRPNELQQPQHSVLIGQRKRRRPLPCTNIYRPVCASYAGVKSSFSNECLVNAENIRTGRNWRIISQGLCGEDSTKMKHNRKYKPKSKPKNMERSKRSDKQQNELAGFENAVHIFAPSTFHTQFISNDGMAMEKSYSLPARKPSSSSKLMSVYGSFEMKPKLQSAHKSCVFSNEPVCGSFNGETRSFSNVCELMQYSQTVGNAWTVLYEGACRQCDKPCPTVYSPICANRNGINYTIINECYLERLRCKDPNSVWRITQRAECAQLNDEVSQSIVSSTQKSASRIPQMLYSNHKATAAKAPAAARKRLHLRKRLRTTTVNTPTPKDMNRKIRKIDAESTDQFAATWASNNNWLLPQSQYSYEKPVYNWLATPTTTTTAQPTTVASVKSSAKVAESQSEQTSIYGLAKDSLIMRLLRAQSSSNSVL
ncbi:uncharacterized protein LOC108601418 [Drosophila busckii]|uniref:uncharacterized protein LOC108601418 n=1 Tax=Drosophila busckii TaxID=30019 RepID=UPI00083F4CD8|nr:uncharacterized protein LOC108601418 [Drosophila busckii]